MSSRIMTIVFGLALSSLPLASLADGRFYESSPAEDAMLPEYCSDAMNGPKGYGGPGMNPAAPRWMKLMGKGFWAMHHYCLAQILQMRLEGPRVTPEQRKRMLEGIVHECDYVMKNSDSDFILRPEILTRKGNALARLRRDNDAARAFNQAAIEKPDYWPAYSGLADLYRTRGKPGEARTVLEEGLKHSPASKTLNEMLAELTKSGAKAVPAQKDASQKPDPPRTPGAPQEKQEKQEQPQAPRTN